MNKIIKTCLKHGELEDNQVYKRERKNKKGIFIQLRCIACCREAVKMWNKKNTKKVNTYARDYYHNRTTEKNRKYDRSEEGKQKKHVNRIKREFKITEDYYNNLFITQNNICAICLNPETSKKKKRLCLDHCHRTGKIRELLCNKCNLLLANVNDSIEILISAVNYLKKHK